MITTTGEYALRAAAFLAQHHGAPQTTAEIAAGTKVPRGYLSKILQLMVKARLVTSQRGLGGGFELADDPDQITIHRVLNSVDALPSRIEHCPLGLKGHVTLCPLHALIDDAVATVETAFQKATLGRLARSAGGVTPLCEETEKPPKNKRPT